MSSALNMIIISKVKEYYKLDEIPAEDVIEVPLVEYYNHDLLFIRLEHEKPDDLTRGEGFIYSVIKLGLQASASNDTKTAAMCSNVLKKAIKGIGRQS